MARIDQEESSAPHHPFLFFGLLILFSLPFWLLGALANAEILPRLPVSAIMVICPVAAATFLVFRANGLSAVASFLRRVADWRRMRRWTWLVALGTMPVVMILSAAMLTAMGEKLPTPEVTLVQTLSLFLLFFVAAAAEELGWTGYATRPLVRSHGLIAAGLIIGIVSSLWHVFPLLQADRGWDWIAWWAIGSIMRRLIITWLYVRGGQSVFSAILFHTMSNLSWMLFPVMGSHYDPATTAIALILVAAFTIGPVGNIRTCR